MKKTWKSFLFAALLCLMAVLMLSSCAGGGTTVQSSESPSLRSPSAQAPTASDSVADENTVPDNSEASSSEEEKPSECEPGEHQYANGVCTICGKERLVIDKTNVEQVIFAAIEKTDSAESFRGEHRYYCVSEGFNDDFSSEIFAARTQDKKLAVFEKSTDEELQIYTIGNEMWKYSPHVDIYSGGIDYTLNKDEATTMGTVLSWYGFREMLKMAIPWGLTVKESEGVYTLRFENNEEDQHLVMDIYILEEGYFAGMRTYSETIGSDDEEHQESEQTYKLFDFNEPLVIEVPEWHRNREYSEEKSTLTEITSGVEYRFEYERRLSHGEVSGRLILRSAYIPLGSDINLVYKVPTELDGIRVNSVAISGIYGDISIIKKIVLPAGVVLEEYNIEVPNTEFFLEDARTSEMDIPENVKQVYFACEWEYVDGVPTKIPAGHNFVNGVCTGCGTKESSEELLFELNETEDGYIVAGLGTCTDTDIIIPDTYRGLPVTEIGIVAFDGCTELTSVTIGNRVTSIDLSAFRDCTGLTSVTIGNRVTLIGDSAFSGCTGLTSIEIPNSVNKYWIWCFRRL